MPIIKCAIRFVLFICMYLHVSTLVHPCHGNRNKYIKANQNSKKDFIPSGGVEAVNVTCTILVKKLFN